jgi:hypothetical protein
MKTPYREQKKIAEKKDDCITVMANKGEVACPPARHYDFLLEGASDIFLHMPFSKVYIVNH